MSTASHSSSSALRTFRRQAGAMRHTLLCLLLALLCLSGCGSPRVGSVADMSGYAGLGETGTQIYVVSDVKDFLGRLDRGESFAAFFGFVGCPWCEDAVPLLTAEAERAGSTVCYINTRPNRHVTRNSEIPDYELLVARIGEHLGRDENGAPYLYVPLVLFVKDGEIVLAHRGTEEGYDPSFMELPEELGAELSEVYRRGFALIQG